MQSEPTDRIPRLSQLTDKSLRQGVRLEWLTIKPSIPNATGMVVPLFKNVTLSASEALAFGIPAIGDSEVRVDIALFDFPPENENHAQMWASLVTEQSSNSQNTYKAIGESIIPQLTSKEILAQGVSYKGKIERDIRCSPHNVFLDFYLSGIKEGKYPLILLGHGGYSISGTDKAIGTYSGDISELAHHVYRSLPLENYSVLLDTTCADTSNPFPPGDLNYDCPIIYPTGEVILKGGTPNELQSGCVVIHDGHATTINWLEILRSRRASGELKSVNL